MCLHSDGSLTETSGCCNLIMTLVISSNYHLKLILKGPFEEDHTFFVDKIPVPKWLGPTFNYLDDKQKYTEVKSFHK